MQLREETWERSRSQLGSPRAEQSPAVASHPQIQQQKVVEEICPCSDGCCRGDCARGHSAKTLGANITVAIHHLQQASQVNNSSGNSVLPQVATCTEPSPASGQARRRRRPRNGFCQKEERPKAGISAARAMLLAARQAPSSPGRSLRSALGAGQGCPGDSRHCRPPVPLRPSTRKNKQNATEQGIAFPLKGQRDHRLLFVYENVSTEAKE